MALALGVILYFVSKGDKVRKYRGKQPSIIASLIVFAVFSALLSLICVYVMGGLQMSIVSCVAGSVLAMLFALLLPYTARKTDYGIDMLRLLVGFKQFLNLAEKQRLEMLLEENPNYYYDTLPFAQALNVSTVWAKKFDGMLTEPPTWFYGAGVNYNSADFGMNAIYGAMQSNVTSMPSSSGGSGGDSGGGFSGGGFSGGGFSGGGSGGGGGGRW